jgi:uncharacterized membrane protein YraQ (UPF0718 family)
MLAKVTAMLATWSGRQTQEIAFAVGALAGLVFAYGAFSVLGRRAHYRTSGTSHRIERTAYLIAALLLSVAFVLSLVGLRTWSGVPVTPAPATASP